jgi:hypothetical protein
MKYNLQPNERVRLVGSIDSYFPLKYGSEGVVIKHMETRHGHDYLVDFGESGIFQIADYDLRPTKGAENFSDRDRIKSRYEEWVDTISEELDWKTSITMEEVQEKYSEIALRYALDIIEQHIQLDEAECYKMLQTKKEEIKKLLDEI